MDALDQRLQILGQAGLLDRVHVDAARALRLLFLQRYGIVLTEDNAAAFFTHFCMALHRMEVNEVIAPVDELIFDELRSQDDYENAALIAEEIDRCVVAIPEWERGYIITHLLVLLGNVRSSYDEEILGRG